MSNLPPSPLSQGPVGALPIDIRGPIANLTRCAPASSDAGQERH
jgi:hypothetical protein